MVCEGPSFWRSMKRNREETGEIFLTVSSKKVSVDSDASKGSQDKGTEVNKPGLTGRQGLLARLATKARKCIGANQKPRTAIAPTRLASGSWKSRFKNSILAKDISQRPSPEI